MFGIAECSVPVLVNSPQIRGMQWQETTWAQECKPDKNQVISHARQKKNKKTADSLGGIFLYNCYSHRQENSICFISSKNIC